MKLKRLKTHGIGHPFRASTPTIDFDELGEGLVALVGQNGAGKTTLLELSGPATLYREFVSYGESTSDHVCPGVRDAFSELTFEISGAEYRALLQIDPEFGGGRGKSEAYLFRAGKPVAGPNIKDYAAEIAKILPPRDLFCASVFAAQGGEGSFLSMGKADRKDMFSAMLGLAHLQEQSESANERAKGVLAALATMRVEMSAARERLGRHTLLTADIEIAAKAVRLAEHDVTGTRQILSGLTAQLATLRESLATAEAEASALQTTRTTLTESRATDTARHAEIEATIAELETAVADVAKVEHSVAELRNVEGALAAATEHERTLTEDLHGVDRIVTMLQSSLDARRSEYARLVAARDAALAAAERCADYETQSNRVADYALDMVAIDAQIDRSESLLPRLRTAAQQETERESQRARLSATISALRDSATLAGVDMTIPMCEACPLTAASRMAAVKLTQAEVLIDQLGPESREAIDALNAAATILGDLRAQRTIAETTLTNARTVLTSMEVDRASAAKLAALDATIADNTRDGKALSAEVGIKTQDRDAIRSSLHTVAVECKRLAEIAHKCRPIAARTPEIASATARLEEQRKQLQEVHARLAETNRQLIALPVPLDLSARRDKVALVKIEADGEADCLKVRELKLREATTQHATMQGELTALGDPAADVGRLEAQERTLVEEAADWQVLAKALGRDGVQALEIDAAGPGVTTIANDLLATCYGPRFALAIETTAEKKDGSQKEVFDVRILDAEAGREARKASGGETVILDEALRLALAIYNSQRSGFELRTLWRDETAGALSPENADRYIQMLKRAREIGGFAQVIFIAHSPDVYQQADRCVHIAGGTATVAE